MQSPLILKLNLYRRSCIIAIIIVLLSIPACKPVKSEFLLTESDIQAPSNLRAVSDWNFFQEEVKMHIFEGGTLRFTIAGFASSKIDRNLKQLLIPLMLLNELPSFVDKPIIDGKNQADLLTYQLKSGMWILVAQISNEQLHLPAPREVASRENY
jgi:hypothetical protein